MATTAAPAEATAQNDKVLSEALAAASISDKDVEAKPELEEGEIEEEEEDDGSPKTVFDSAARFNLKHPLYAKWTLYFDSPQSKLTAKTEHTTIPNAGAHGGWLDDMRRVIEFDSVEEFWGLYNNIVPPSQLPGKANYYLFKDGILPAWEDAQNKNGGKWAIQVPRDKTKGQIDQMWLYTMLAAIGETFESGLDGSAPERSDLITGVIMSCRPGFYRIALWTRDAPDVSLTETDELMKRILTIGRYFKVSVLGYPESQKLVTGGYQTEVVFESHKDSERKGNKNKLTI
ncbi:hypothetical protein CspeluHIS016_0503340 [Cutaneotrichosporon spelunceum]|uniref:Eukaryotic translation initiation factor 4E n=1 Tax=Cutaneotrichosporon spelunceum TaxID=1672016 RepID=A0AAD3TXM2_9TREE|nr:hypothetical protein CspeluHIS016_0503340 [Cutaneotrichosporon spelunceum]